MFTHHLRMALRSILHRKLYSVIAAMSLAIGLTVSLLILAFVRFEISFDSMHFDSDHMYRLNWLSPDGSHFATFMNPLSPFLETALPEIESVTRLGRRQHLFTVGDVDQYQTLTMVDGNFFDFFNYRAIAGIPSEAIRDVSSAVITEAAAVQLFQTTDVIGRSFVIDGGHTYRVAALIENNPGNSHLISNIYVNLERLPEVWNNPGFWENLGSDVLYHYVKLAPDADPQVVAANAMDFVSENNGGVTFDIVLQPLRDIHFTANLQNEMSTRDDVTGLVKPLRQRSDIYLFSGVALLALGIAAFNFMNLQAVQLIRRRKEIGIRRVAGASTLEMTSQFLVETGVIALVSFALAFLLCLLSLPFFSTMVAAPMNAGTFITFPNIALLAGMALSTGLLAGIYPAISSASMSPILALRGETATRGKTRNRFRSTLIIAQFSISIGLIIASGIVNLQINYALQKSLGFNPDDIVTIELPNNTTRAAYDVLRENLLAEPGVASVSAGTIIPTRDLSDGTVLSAEGVSADEAVGYRMVFVGEDYFSTLGMQFVAGRALSDNFATDRTNGFSLANTERYGGVVINETGARAAGFSSPDEAIGKALFSEGMFQGRLYRSDFRIVGVIADAHFQSVRTTIVPMVFLLNDARNVMLVKLTDGSEAATLAIIDRYWRELVPEYPIQRNFLADSYAAFYSSETRTFALFTGLSTVAILIACLGLYALASFIAERRTKEISIRKVLGATVASIAAMLAWDFSKLVIIANLVAWPLAWWSMQQWLANFAYRADINIGLFLFAGLATFLMAMATTFQRAYSVAVANPVHALRSE